MRIKKILTYHKNRPVYMIKCKTFLFWYTEAESYDKILIDKLFLEMLKCKNVEK